jgi:hypothetical protein
VPRAIAMRHTVAPAPERDEFRERARQSLAHYSSSGCRYWLFEESGLPGAYVEFFEAGDPDTLQRAHRSAPAPLSDNARLYVEVELT